ncbi:MAG: sigma-70 region 4 domain-containing protein [Planctomycetes bacterium]|nr:sigma-70 region 4 domain-containing protein [Planctomycetota bacterium]
MRPEYDRILSHDAHLDTHHWNNLDAKHKNWSEYNRDSDQIQCREKSVRNLIDLIKSDVLPKLTERQRQITLLYFESQSKEDEIARILGISQPTVSQHLFGKKRNGKKVGGSIQKMRKIIRKNSSQCSALTQKDLMTALRQILKDKMSVWQELSYFE